MKKYILSAFLVLGILFSPAFASPVEASALTAYQITSIISLLQAFGADQSVINNVQTALGGGGGGGGGFCYTFTTDLTVGSTGAAVTALNQALSSSGINTSGNTSTFTESTAADVVAFQARYGISQTGYVGSLTRTKLNQLYGCTGSGGTPTATLTVNGGVTATEVDPLLPRTWAWSSTNGSSYNMSAIISGCETASQNGTVTNWTPWVDGSGTGASGSNTQTPGIVKYGCTIVGTYTATNAAGQPTSASATITFKHATSQANTFTLSVSNTGTGTGTVTSAPAGTTFASGTSVTLTATPTSGSTFAGWSGACTGTASVCTVSMTANRVVSAMFNSTTGGTYSLSITNIGTGSGTISSAPTGTSFASGTSVTLAAAPASGSTFAGWSGACTGTAPVCTLTMTESKSVTGTFNMTSAGTFTLSVSKTGTGTGTVTSVPTGTSFASGTSVTLTATPASGSTFAGWSGACTGATAPTCTVAMDSNRSVSAMFNTTSAAGSSTLSVTLAGTGSGTVTSMQTGIGCGSGGTLCSSSYTNGTSVTLAAVPASAGSTFAGWSGACTGTSTYCTVTMSENKSVTATFNNTGGNTCTSWNTGSWTPATCPASGTQTRSVTGVPANCTGGTPPSSSQSCTPPQTPTCTGTHPAAGNGVVLNDYSITTTGPSGPSNTVWGYVDDVGFSCSWGCTFPTTRNGNIGCTPAKAGDGVTVTVNDLSTGQRIPGVTITAGTVFGLGSNFAAVGLGGGSGTFTTDNNGVAPEFLFQSGPSGSWTSLAVQVPAGYRTSKIRSAIGCSERVYVNGGKQWNYCVNAANKTPVTINLVPGDISTTPIVSFTKSSYTTSESLSGTVVGGDPSHTWGCIQRNGNTNPAETCTSGYSTPWRQLGSSIDVADGAAGWNLVSDNQGDRIVLQALPLASFPPDTYTMYVRIGTSVLDSSGPSSHASATLTGAAPAGAAANATTKSLVINLSGAGSGSIVSSSPSFVANHNMGTPNESAQYTATVTNNAQVTLMGAPAGATITWTGCDSTSGGDGRNCIVTMSSNRTVNATFTKI